MKTRDVAWVAGAVGLLVLIRRRWGMGWGQRGSGDGWGASPDEGGEDQGGDDPAGHGDDRGRAPLLEVDSPLVVGEGPQTRTQSAPLLLRGRVTVSGLRAALATKDAVEREVVEQAPAIREAVEGCPWAPELVGTPHVAASGSGGDWVVVVVWPARWAPDTQPPEKCLQDLDVPGVTVSSVRRGRA